jgi:hypothetical protein
MNCYTPRGLAILGTWRATPLPVALKRRKFHFSYDLRVLHNSKGEGEVTMIDNHFNGRIISISENVAN